MEISYKWLQQYLPTSLSAEQISILLTDCGLEIESLEKYESVKGGFEHVVIGKVLTCEAHPDSDHLHLTTVDVGEATPLNIVCGAPNVAAGQTVVVARIGATLYPSEGEPFSIKKSKIRGAVSEGMICAEDELGIGEDHAGIMVLPSSIAAGTAAKDYFKVETDDIFGIGLTPNRSDAICHIGVARDLVASIHQHYKQLVKLEIPDVSAFPTKSFKNPVTVTITDSERCPRYSSLFIKGVKVAESPDWLKNRLRCIGIRPINNIVDITQFVMLECGQPLHAFDAADIEQNQVIVRTAKQDEEFITLDGIERKLSSEDLVICNHKEPMCLAGVMGGKHSGISDNTCNVFLESAYFQAAGIRKTSKRHALKTDASFRYERGCDPNITLFALKRAALLIQEIAGGEISEITDVYPKPIENAIIGFPLEKLNDLTGKVIEKEIVCQILKDLDIAILKDNGAELTLSIPTNKVDVTRVADVVEEILRIYGYNNIPMPDHFEYKPSTLEENPLLEVKERISTYLSDNGFFEIMNNSLTKSDYSNYDFINKAETITLMNPLSKELQDMRQTLLFGGLESIVNNINHSNFDLRLYEFGTIYRKDTLKGTTDEVPVRFPHQQRLAIWVSGKQHRISWQKEADDCDIFYLKNMILNALQRCNFQLQRLKTEMTEKENGLVNVLKYSFNNEVIIRMGELHPEILKNFGIKQKVCYAETDCDKLVALLERKKIIFKDLNRFPEVERDLALLVDEAVSYETLEKMAYKCNPAIKTVQLFDVYEGKNLEKGKKSYALKFIISNKEKTFTNDEIQAIMDKLIAMYEKSGAQLR